MDDHPANVKLLRVLLASQGYDVKTAGDAPEALEILESYRPDLILMDVQLPGMDGLELTRRIRQREDLAGVKIVAVTSYALPGDREKALGAGCDGYVSKPVDTRALPGVIAAYIRGERPT